MQYSSVSPAEFEGAGLADWRVVVGTARADFRAASFSDAATLVSSIAVAADAAVHHPDIDLRYPGRVRITLTTHATGGLTTADVDLARVISSLAEEAGAVSDPLASQAVELAIDTTDASAIRPFWAAVLGYQERDGELHDPAGDGPAVWFQTMDEARSERNRLHFDVVVPVDVAKSRIDAALAAGGRLVTDEFAPSWWVLADVDGNEACVCTWQDR